MEGSRTEVVFGCPENAGDLFWVVERFKEEFLLFLFKFGGIRKEWFGNDVGVDLNGCFFMLFCKFLFLGVGGVDLFLELVDGGEEGGEGAAVDIQEGGEKLLV